MLCLALCQHGGEKWVAVTKPVSPSGGCSDVASGPWSLRQVPDSSAPSQLPHQQTNLNWLNNLLLNMCFSWIETAQPLGNLCCGKGGSERYFLIKKKKRHFKHSLYSAYRVALGPRESSGCWAVTAAVASLLAALKKYIALLGRWWWRQSTTFSNVIQSSTQSIQVAKETSNGMLLQSRRTKVFTLLLAASMGFEEAPGGPAQDTKRSECAGRRLGFTMRAVLLGNL